MPIKGAAITVQYVAWDTALNTGKTGDAGNHTIRGVGDGTEYTPAATPVQVDATNLPGVYKLAIAAGENNYDLVTLGGKSATANVAIMPITWTNTCSITTLPGIPANWLTAAGIAAGALNGKGDWSTTAAPTAAAIATAVLTTAMTEDYSTDGAAPTLAQAMFITMQRLTDFGIVGTSINVHKLNGTTTAYQLTLDSATAPTSSTRTS